jgi:hypothetical protein
MIRIVSLIIVIATLSINTYAQFYSSIDVSYTHDSNIFGNYAKVPDNYLSVDLFLENDIDWDYSSLTTSYDGSLSSFNAFPEQDSWTHNLNFKYRMQLSRVAKELSDNEDSAATQSISNNIPADSLETFLTISGFIERTVPHAGDFEVYQNYLAGGAANLRIPLGNYFAIRMNYIINYTNFDFVSSLTNLENKGSLYASLSPSASISLFAFTSYGNKKFYGVDSVSSNIKKLIRMHGLGVYNGKGKGHRSGNNQGQVSSQTKTYILDSPDVNQLTYGGGVQLSSDLMSGSIEASYRKDISGAARYVNAVAEFIAQKSSIYDDPYSYEGPELKLVARREKLFDGLTINFGVNYAYKLYERPAFDYTQIKELAEQRKDKYLKMSVGISEKFDRFILNGVTFSLSYDIIRNSSNDEYYNFTDNILTASFETELF